MRIGFVLLVPSLLACAGDLQDPVVLSEDWADNAQPDPSVYERADSAFDASGMTEKVRRDSDSLCETVDVDITVELSARPVDIVWVIDSSGSMRNEAQIVQENMNRFVQAFSHLEQEVQTVLVADTDYVNVPPPLGTDATRFLHINHRVSSRSALLDLLMHWDAYKHRLRPDSMVHFVVVTDDESSLPAPCFIDEMRANLGEQRELRLHTVSSEGISEETHAAVPVFDLPACGERYHGEEIFVRACTGAARPGLQYWGGAKLTGGEALSICTSNWSEVFETLADNAERVSIAGCETPVPALPSGVDFNSDEVELLAHPQSGDTLRVAQIPDASACEGGGGWYFDDANNPTQLTICEQTCFELGTADVGLELDMNCAFVLR